MLVPPPDGLADLTEPSGWVPSSRSRAEAGDFAGAVEFQEKANQLCGDDRRRRAGEERLAPYRDRSRTVRERSRGEGRSRSPSGMLTSSLFNKNINVIFLNLKV
jgi:hypothetical protein